MREQCTRCLVPALLESAHRASLAHELRNGGLRGDTEVGLPIVYDGEKLDIGHRIDLLVENLVTVEAKVRGSHPSGARSSAAIILAMDWKGWGPTSQFPSRSF